MDSEEEKNKSEERGWGEEASGSGVFFFLLSQFSPAEKVKYGSFYLKDRRVPIAKIKDDIMMAAKNQEK